MAAAIEMKSKSTIEVDQASSTGGTGADVSVAGSEQDSHMPVVGKITQALHGQCAQSLSLHATSHLQIVHMDVAFTGQAEIEFQ